MDYQTKYRQLAEELWTMMHKGPLYNDDGEFRKLVGLSGGEGVIHKVCKAIAEPGDNLMPPLDEIAHRLSTKYQDAILAALQQMIKFRC